ncbi:MAG: hypothetical protein ACRDH2_03995, partial [Anaerolineales bacterium]
LSQSARLSSITIELLPYILNQPVDARWRPAETAREALDDLVGSLRGFGDFIIYFGIAVLPWLVLGGMVAYGVVRLNRGRRARAEQGKPASNP